MASKPLVQCPVCNEEMPPDHDLEEHLLGAHSKRELARYVVAENEHLDETDASD